MPFNFEIYGLREDKPIEKQNALQYAYPFLFWDKIEKYRDILKTKWLGIHINCGCYDDSYET